MICSLRKAISLFLLVIAFGICILNFNPTAALAEDETITVQLGASAADSLIFNSPPGGGTVLPQGRCFNTSSANPLQMIGVVSRQVWTGNIPIGQDQALIKDKFSVPNNVGLAIPVMQGWAVGYGQAAKQFTWRKLHPRGVDHHLGLAYVDAKVTGYSGQTVTVETRIQLADENGDDPWVGAARYDVLLFKQGACDPKFSS
jgi:hypothetical protein